MDHPNIVKLYSHYEDKENINLLLEIAAGGELDKIIKEQIPIQES